MFEGHLEHQVSANEYNADVNLAILKLYQFSPELSKPGVLAQGEEALRDAGMTRQKARYIHGIAAAGLGIRDVRPADIIATYENMIKDGPDYFCVGIDHDGNLSIEKPGGGKLTLTSDMNSFDLMLNLIGPRREPPKSPRAKRLESLESAPNNLS